MKAFKMIFVLSFSTFFCASCQLKTQDNVANPLDKSIVIPFLYESKLTQWSVMIEGSISDTIPQRFIFDTGAFGVTVMSKLKGKISSPTFSLQLADVKFPNSIEVGFFSNNSLYPDIFGTDNVALLGWRFLEGKVFGLFFSDKSLRIWDDIKDVKNLGDYDSVKIERTFNDYWFTIPACISVQGKRIEEKVIIDTGFNGGIDFDKNIASEYNFDLEGIRVGKTLRMGGFVNKKALIADTIKIGKQILTEEKQYIGFFNKTKFDPESIGRGILGLSVLRHFDFIIDSKNNNLYLKRIQE
jgi:predicted aspartyl protease